MKQSYFPLGVVAATVFGALIGMVLRIYQIGNCMDANGLIRVGNPILYILLAVSVLFVALIALLCSKLNRSLGSENDLCATPVFLFADLVGAVCIFYGALQRLIDGGSLFLFIGGMEAALFFAAAALLYGKRSKVVVWLLLLCCLFFAGQLIYDFKHWSTDPQVIDFCFRLLAQVSGMLALLHLSSFLLSYGHKRITIFWSACTVMFTLMLLPDLIIAKSITIGEFMIPLGTAIWCGSHALRLLRAAVQEEDVSASSDEEEA